MTISKETLAQVSTLSRSILAEVGGVFVGPPAIAELILISLYARGHVLLEGVPGVAKTTLCKAFAACLGCSFRRIQFTPDLLPADITGSHVFSPQTGAFELREGPVFTQILLGDEINRAPAKTQSALLEAMQEQQATIEGNTRALPNPFLVLATQNPIEQAGTYPLPEAQLDRFLVRILIEYPEEHYERTVLERALRGAQQARAIVRANDVVELQQWVQHVFIEASLLDYIVRLANHTRSDPRVLLGVSPRASVALMHAARARALIHGRDYVLPDDIKALSAPVFAHRLLIRDEAALDGVRSERVVQEAVQRVPYTRVTSYEGPNKTLLSP